jgi:hypothetical protein
MTKKRVTGLVLIGLSIAAFFLDRFTHAISSLLARLICGDQYLKPVDGVLGDGSCGFNADMYLVVFLLVALAAGAWLFIFSKKR